MTKNDYLKKIENLSQEAQIETLRDYFNKFKNSNDYESAEIVCEILANDLDEFGFQIALIDTYLLRKKYKEVINYGNLFFEKYPDAIKLADEVLYNMGKAYEELNDWQNAMNSYIKICDNIELRANHFANGIISDSEKQNLIISLNNVARIWYKLKEYNAAYNFFDKSWEVMPNIYSAYHIGILNYNGLGTTKDIQTAEKLLLKIYDSDCDLSNEEKAIACYTLGLIYAKENGYINKTKAEKFLNKAKMLGHSISDTEIEALINNISSTSKEKKSGGCYVATCVYGSYDCPQVWTLRRYRDDILSSSLLGRIFIKLYYNISPTIVNIFGKQKWFHKLCKKPLDALINKLNNIGIENTKYIDK